MNDPLAGMRQVAEEIHEWAGKSFRGWNSRRVTSEERAAERKNQSELERNLEDARRRALLIKLGGAVELAEWEQRVERLVAVCRRLLYGNQRWRQEFPSGLGQYEPDLKKAIDEENAGEWMTREDAEFHRALQDFEVAAAQIPSDSMRPDEASSKSCTKTISAPDVPRLNTPARKAFRAFKYAEEKRGESLSDREAFEDLKESGVDERDPKYGDLADYATTENLPSFETFRRNLSKGRSAAGESKYNRGKSKTPGRSTVRIQDL